MWAVRCGARGSAAHLRAVIGPLAVADPYDPHAPVKQGYRDGVAAEELWPLVARSRRRFQEIWEAQAERMYRQALTILEESLGPMHPRTQQVRWGLQRLEDAAGPAEGPA